MKPSQLITLLTKMLVARLPVLIVGGPGIGKTSIAKAASAAVDNDLVITHPGLSDPTDAKGFPWVDAGAKHATFKPFGDVARVLESTKPTTWMLDDFGQATAATQVSFMPWLLERRVNGHVLPDHVTIIASTNRRTDRAGVTGILEPVKSRFATIVELAPDLDEWCQWALGQPFMPPELVAFQRFKAGAGRDGHAEDVGLLYQFTPTADLVNFPAPRTWENAGRILGLGLPADVEARALMGAVGEGAAVELLGFLKMYRELPSVDGILLDPDGPPIPKQPAALYAVSTALAARSTEANFGRVARYAKRLADAGHGEFTALLVRDATRRTPALQQTPDFVRLAASDLGQLLGGASAD
jgi:dynein-related subfamily AAA family protein